MKTILVIIDGLSEDKIHELGNKTPLEFACTPFIDKIIDQGHHSQKTFFPPHRQPDSLNCILAILGVHEQYIPKNRAYLEALASNIQVEHDEVVLRCNLISVKGGKMESFNGKNLTEEQMKSASLNVKTKGDIKFYHVSGYRNLIVLKKSREIMWMENMPPHEYVGSSMAEITSNFENIEILKEFVFENKFSINGLSYMFYPWGPSEPSEIPSFHELYNKSCSCVCRAEIVKGIAKAMKMDVAVLKNSTADVDTDLREKSSAVLRELKDHDVVIAHINGTDEASHRKDLSGKISFIEKIDRDFIGEIYNNLDDTKIIVVSDHQTSSLTGRHEKGNVDVICFEKTRGKEKLWLK
jgi:2,3-bisphosphoglycerate-independent phosphoglycerate mutase